MSDINETDPVQQETESNTSENKVFDGDFHNEHDNFEEDIDDFCEK